MIAAFTKRIFAGTLLVSGLAGCVTAPEFPPADLDAPGWQLWTGQAVWKPADARAPKLAGDLIVARNGDGEVLINFVKSPLPLFTARTWDGYWRIRFVERGREYSGGARPPAKRFVWFALPDILQGGPPPRPWVAESSGDMAWRLENPKTGETVRIALDP